MPTIIDPLATHARAHPNARAMVNLHDSRYWTFAELTRDIDRVAAWIVEKQGPGSGARVATLARNCAEMIILQQACIRAGAIFVPFNWRLAIPEIAVLIADSQPAVLFYDKDFVIPANVVPSFDIASLLDVARPEQPAYPASARRAFDDVCMLLYTSGTSGTPKGVMVTAANAFWGATNFMHGNDVVSTSIFLCDMPLFHTAGLCGAAGASILAGATLLVSRGFEAATTLARLHDPDLAVTHYFSVPQMAQMMWNSPGFEPEMLRGLKVYAMGGAPNPAAQIERFVRAGIRMSDGFGMSETCSNYAMPAGDPALLLAKAGSCGLPFLSMSERIVDEDGNDLPCGEVGELLLSGPSVSPGYWNKPEQTAAAFKDGWFRTGDAAMRDDDGFLYLVDRRKDMFISGGENVYPAEVEAVLTEIEAIAEAAVVGVADEQWGEVGHAFIILRDGDSLTSEEVIGYCNKRLARFKVPKAIVFGADIPRTASGKVQKHLLKLKTVS